VPCVFLVGGGAITAVVCFPRTKPIATCSPLSRAGLLQENGERILGQSLGRLLEGTVLHHKYSRSFIIATPPENLDLSANLSWGQRDRSGKSFCNICLRRCEKTFWIDWRGVPQGPYHSSIHTDSRLVIFGGRKVKRKRPYRLGLSCWGDVFRDVL